MEMEWKGGREMGRLSTPNSIGTHVTYTCEDGKGEGVEHGSIQESRTKTAACPYVTMVR